MLWNQYGQPAAKQHLYLTTSGPLSHFYGMHYPSMEYSIFTIAYKKFVSTYTGSMHNLCAKIIMHNYIMHDTCEEI